MTGVLLGGIFLWSPTFGSHLKVFDRGDIITYNSSISACARMAEWEVALALSAALRKQKLKQDGRFLVCGFDTVQGL